MSCCVRSDTPRVPVTPNFAKQEGYDRTWKASAANRMAFMAPVYGSKYMVLHVRHQNLASILNTGVVSSSKSSSSKFFNAYTKMSLVDLRQYQRVCKRLMTHYAYDGPCREEGLTRERLVARLLENSTHASLQRIYEDVLLDDAAILQYARTGAAVELDDTNMKELLHLSVANVQDATHKVGNAPRSSKRCRKRSIA